MFLNPPSCCRCDKEQYIPVAAPGFCEWVGQQKNGWANKEKGKTQNRAATCNTAAVTVHLSGFCVAVLSSVLNWTKTYNSADLISLLIDYTKHIQTEIYL